MATKPSCECWEWRPDDLKHSHVIYRKGSFCDGQRLVGCEAWRGKWKFCPYCGEDAAKQ